MTAPLREQITNNAASQLDGGIDDTQTTIDVDDGTVFPSTGKFRIVIDSELLLCTSRSGATLTVVRGAESSVAASHSDNAPVTHIVTAGSVESLGRGNDPSWGLRPAMGIYDDNGLDRLDSSDFTSVNASGVTISDPSETILIAKPAHSGESVTALVKTAPGTPYVYQAAFQLLFVPDDDATGMFPAAGLTFRKNSDGRLYGFGVVLHSTLDSPMWVIYRWDNPTTFQGRASDEFKFVASGNQIWLRIEDNGTDLKFYIGMDGIVWQQVYSESRTTHMTGGPDEVGIFISNASSSSSAVNPNYIRLTHWSRVS